VIDCAYSFASLCNVKWGSNHKNQPLYHGM
jgi:hypothetical protein